jgi:hypothetical protein
MGVVATDIVSLRPESLNEGFLRPALDGESSLLNTLDCGVSIDKRFLRFANRVVCSLYAFIEDSRDLPFV